MKIKYIITSKESRYYSGKKSGGTNLEAKSFFNDSVECHEGKGIVGDRFYNYEENYKGQITFISYNLHLKMQEHFGREIDMKDYRRNVFIEGDFDLLSLIGKTFKIGDSEFLGVEDCAPCKWMDKIIGEGSKSWMKENISGGLRARILKSGQITLGNEITDIV